MPPHAPGHTTLYSAIQTSTKFLATPAKSSFRPTSISMRPDGPDNSTPRRSQRW